MLAHSMYNDSTHNISLMTTDLITIGSGIIGMTLANVLAGADIKVVLIDIRDPFEITHHSSDGRVSAIAYGSKEFFDKQQIWPLVAQEAEPIFNIHITDDASPLWLHYDHQLIGEQPMG